MQHNQEGTGSWERKLSPEDLRNDVSARLANIGVTSSLEELLNDPDFA